jgi:hypothetical protein
MKPNHEAVLQRCLDGLNRAPIGTWCPQGIVGGFIAIDADDELIKKKQVIDPVAYERPVSVHEAVAVPLLDGPDDLADIGPEERFSTERDDDLRTNSAGLVKEVFEHFQRGLFAFLNLVTLVQRVHEALAAIVIAELRDQDLRSEWPTNLEPIVEQHGEPYPRSY